MEGVGALKNVRYVVVPEGRPAAAQLSIEDWRALLDYLPGLEDRALVKSSVARLQKGPEEAKAVPWEKARPKW